MSPSRYAAPADDADSEMYVTNIVIVIIIMHDFHTFSIIAGACDTKAQPMYRTSSDLQQYQLRGRICYLICMYILVTSP